MRVKPLYDFKNLEQKVLVFDQSMCALDQATRLELCDQKTLYQSHYDRSYQVVRLSNCKG